MTRTLAALFLLLIALLPRPVEARPPTASALPGLSEFVARVSNGLDHSLVAVYAGGRFALPVVQQPEANAAFISEAPEALTQFGPAAGFATIGLLAHNFLSGQYFSQLAPGQSIVLIYGTGRLEFFTITSIERYRALIPESIFSQFISLDNGLLLSSADLADEIYNQPGHVVFQTCIAANGIGEWGRLFVIAEPDPLRAQDRYR